ncbi:MAG: Rossmann-like and DUF2520 domain-containing protein [Pyrinomonadaceae bacterium]
MQSVSIIGIGRLGGALALALTRSGFVVENLIFRRSETAAAIANKIPNDPKLIDSTAAVDLKTDIIFITTPDPEIEAVALKLSNVLTGRPFVFHTSGSLSSKILYKLREIGCETGSIHPLISVSDPFRGANRFEGTYFCIEGDDAAVKLAGEIANTLGGLPFTIDTRFKPLYHASAVTASGHLVALFDAALEMIAACGVKNGVKILLPLVRSTVANLETQTTGEALTGTFARADAYAFRRHLESMEQNVTDGARNIYLELAARSLALAELNGANAGDIATIRREISIAKRKSE